MPVDERLELRRLADQYVEGGNFGLPRLVELRDVLGRGGNFELAFHVLID